MKKLFFATIFLLFFKLSNAQQAGETSVRNILLSQETAWNGGNIDDFMKGYWHNDSLMFIGKSGIIYGWEKHLTGIRKVTRIPQRWESFLSIYSSLRLFLLSVILLLEAGI